MKSFLQKIYTYALLDEFILIYPVYAIFFQERGLSPIHIASLFMMWSLITILFEVPTGILADTFSRRNILGISQLLKCSGYVCWLMFQTYGGFALGFALWGIGGTLMSGTFESFVYDELKYFRQEKLYERVYGRIIGLRLIGITIAMVLGGIVANIDFTYALYPSILIPLIAMGVILTMQPAQATKSTGERKYWHILCEAIRETKGNPYLMRLMIYFAIVFGVMWGADEYWGIFYREIGLSLPFIGALGAIGCAIGAMGSFTAHKWRLPGKRVYTIVLISVVPILMLAYWRNTFIIPFIFFYAYMIQVVETKLEARMQGMISSHQRATISSMKNMLLEIIAIGFYVCVGLLAVGIGYGASLWILCATCGTMSVLYLFIRTHSLDNHAIQ